MIPPELRARIRRLFFAEHWKVGTIASELAIHHDTVRKAIEFERFFPVAAPLRPTGLDPYKPLILETLEQHPRLRATRLFEMVSARGFSGSVGAGCPVVLKPSELSSLQTRVMVEALHEAGLPKGVLNVVTGLGTVVGAELVRNPDVAKISFTGSVGVGQQIMRDGAATMKRITLELGGKSPTVLLDDAAFEQAVPSALVMAFLNSGQACAAGTRLLVPRSRLGEVKQAILKAMPAFAVGDPADPKTAVGPMVSPNQYERVQSYIRKGLEEGAEVLAGGTGRPNGFEAGFFVKPTVFVNVNNDMAIAQEEIFGPVLCVITYDSEDDAIRIANDSRYGLHAAVLGTDLQRARRVASQIRSGRVVINNMTDDPQAPWGGFKYSGVGREYAGYGIEAFLETKAILE